MILRCRSWEDAGPPIVPSISESSITLRILHPMPIGRTGGGKGPGYARQSPQWGRPGPNARKAQDCRFRTGSSRRPVKAPFGRFGAYGAVIPASCRQRALVDCSFAASLGGCGSTGSVSQPTFTDAGHYRATFSWQSRLTRRNRSYLPDHSGLRFPANARGPSMASWLANIACASG
jgi:hypothetical protein